ncbi:MAG: hypothetical protein AUH92_02655 [Acidobacteria bacterium 13_1_40CM_4_69_4]|nr:MAG: hypothetical protein AUH92_02655 [Acidobacteria bacterium 13_1_40CM_4_69_4]
MTYRVVCVSSGGQALKKVSEVRPDVILLDVIMPEKNGYEVCEQLKRSPATSGIPVLLLTGTFEPFDRKRAEAAGANGHLTKPFESQALVAKVEELIASTPSVAVDDQGGRMDIISGGDIYHVDPARAAEGMRPSMPAADGDLRTAAPGTTARTEPVAPALSSPVGRSFAQPPVGEEKEAEGRPHPALAAPDPGAGGSYVGFADVGLDPGMEGSIVPDRFDESAGGAASASTARLRRDKVVPAREVAPSGASGIGAGPAGPGVDEAFGGSFEAEFDLVDEVPPGPAIPDVTAEPEDAPAWTPPPEAPPAETWQASDEPSPAPPAAREADRPPVADGKRLGLTPEMIELIAEKVVERLSDRVVREIAWEVVPGVAETLVRRRIKDLEEG